MLGDVLPALAVQGLTGAAAGAAAGGAAGAAAYGLGCRSSTAGCSWTGLAATGKTAAGGAITGAAFAVAGSAAGDAWAGLKGASCHSFTGSARVLMADGTSKPISRVKAGDRVTDSVPGDDSTQVHTVQKVIVTATDRDFTQLTIKPSHPAGTTARPGTAQRLRGAAAVLAGAAVLATGLAASPAMAATAAGGTLTTTYTHPFYDITQASFTPARNLHVGDQLQQPGGRTAVITGIRLFHTTQTTYDLTINGLQTYYVLAGNTPVLVHNCDTIDFAHGTSLKNAQNIRENGLSADAAKANQNGASLNQPGSFFTHKISGPTDDGIQSAYEWGLRVDPESPSSVLIGRLSKSTYDSLVEQGLVTVRNTGEGVPDETIFHPDSFPALNRDMKWLKILTP